MKQKKLYKRWWMLALVVLVIVVGGVGISYRYFSQPQGIMDYQVFRKTANDNLSASSIDNQFGNISNDNQRFVSDGITLHAKVNHGQLLDVSTAGHMNNKFALSMFSITKTLSIPNSVVQKLTDKTSGALLSGVKKKTISWGNMNVQMVNMDDNIYVLEVSRK